MPRLLIFRVNFCHRVAACHTTQVLFQCRVSGLAADSSHRSHEYTYKLLTDLTMRFAFATHPYPPSLIMAFPLSYHYPLGNSDVLLT